MLGGPSFSCVTRIRRMKISQSTRPSRLHNVEVLFPALRKSKGIAEVCDCLLPDSFAMISSRKSLLCSVNLKTYPKNMKLTSTRILVAILLAFGFASVQAQSFSVSPSNSVSATVYENGLIDMNIDFQNLTQDSLSLQWETMNNSLNSNWQITLCDYGACYFGVPTGKVMDPVPPGDKGFLKLSITVDNTTGPAAVSFKVWEEGVPSTEEIVTFNLDVILNAAGITLEKQVQMFPNPVSNTLNFQLPEKLTGSELMLFNAQGAVVATQTIAAGQTEVDVTALPVGTYFARLTTKEGVVSKRFLKMD